MLYDLLANPPRLTAGPKVTLHAATLAFHPGDYLLAGAGGTDHKVASRDLRKVQRKHRTLVQGPGRARRTAGLGGRGPRRVLVFNGHRGGVMALAPSADQQVLLTASRDQTLAAWSLVDWPSQSSLGARFEERLGKLFIDAVDPGSPAWESGLT